LTFGGAHAQNYPKKMKTTLNNHKLKIRLGFIAILAAAALVLPVARGQDASRSKAAIPMIQIQMDNVPLKDAIRNIARQAGLNYIFDPRLSGSWVGPDGKTGPEPSVTVRWENLTADQALDRLLKAHGLTMVSSPATAIARIASTNQAVKPVSASQVGNGTNAVIPVVVMEFVPLAEAIRQLAAQAHLHLALDPALSVPSSEPVGGTISDSFVSFRWNQVTARQALAALLDNYDLVLVLDPGASPARIMARAQTESGQPPKER
jgi:hypothetical protein